MFKESYNTIGVMSGTSLDGIDLAHVTFTLKNKQWVFEILETETISYDQNWLNKLKIAVGFSVNELEELNSEYTQLLASTVANFITFHKIEAIDAICSHGHTILHQPQNGLTLQIGNLPQITEMLRQTVVCDFRVQDVAFGGQGAPLVPIGDRILFSEFDYCLNLGGFSNISFEENNNRIAFDICPVNTVLNFYANQFALDYDDKGTISKSGKVNSELLNELNALSYYEKTFPKSLGFEFVKEVILPIIESYTITTEDKLRTFSEHVAFQIGSALKIKTGKILISGGGAYNDFLIERIRFELPEMNIVIPTQKVLEFKEALIFALLGVLRLRNEINVLSSVTGARKDHSSGKIWHSK